MPKEGLTGINWGRQGDVSLYMWISICCFIWLSHGLDKYIHIYARLHTLYGDTDTHTCINIYIYTHIRISMRLSYAALHGSYTLLYMAYIRSSVWLLDTVFFSFYIGVTRGQYRFKYNYLYITLQYNTSHHITLHYMHTHLCMYLYIYICASTYKYKHEHGYTYKSKLRAYDYHVMAWHGIANNNIIACGFTCVHLYMCVDTYLYGCTCMRV